MTSWEKGELIKKKIMKGGVEEGSLVADERHYGALVLNSK